MRNILRFILLLALTSAPLRAASAHPKLLRAIPASGSRVISPREIRLTFNEAITPALSRISLLDAALRPVAVGQLGVAGDDEHAIVVAVTAALTPGRYAVRWQAAAADGHPVRGTFTFEITSSAGQ